MNTKISHSYIYAGPKGRGKYKSAREFANKLTGGNVADIVEVTNQRYDTGDGAMLSVDAVRAAAVDAYKRPYSDWKVFIFGADARLNHSCQNALLKLLEEPPDYCVFIIIVENPAALLPTIRSRAVLVRFNQSDDGEIRRQLAQKYEGTELELAISLVDGNLERAELFIQDDDLIKFCCEAKEIICGVMSENSRGAYLAISFFEENKDKKDLLFDIMTCLFRDKLLISAQGNGTIKRKRSAVEFVERIQRARQALLQNANYNMVITDLLLRCWEDF